MVRNSNGFCFICFSFELIQFAETVVVLLSCFVHKITTNHSHHISTSESKTACLFGWYGLLTFTSHHCMPVISINGRKISERETINSYLLLLTCFWRRGEPINYFLALRRFTVFSRCNACSELSLAPLPDKYCNRLPGRYNKRPWKDSGTQKTGIFVIEISHPAQPQPILRSFCHCWLK